MPGPHTVSEGCASPLGNDVQMDGVNFALFSAHATSVTLCLFSPDGQTETAQIPLPRKTGDIWHGHIKGLREGQLYGYRVDGPYAPHEGHRFNANKLLIDPYAKTLFGEFIEHEALYGFDVHAPDKDLSFNTADSAPYVPKSVVGRPAYDWEEDRPPRTKWADTIIYEAHVKGLTQRRADIAPAHRGTLGGLSDPAMIAHLVDLGITAIELLPLQSFMSEPRLTHMGLSNYWGYNPVNYFAPHAPYLGPSGTRAIQDAVKALHAANIEVILDVVYNHTAESWELGPTLSYRGIDNASYYHLAEDKRFYVNHTGCGNTLDMSHPRVLELTIESLRYWAEHMRIDGFRFDLAPTLARNPYDYDKAAPFFGALRNDPVLSRLKLIAEPWDIGPNGYVLGQFPNEWAEWNDRFRDDVRSFWRGDENAHKSLAGALLGSAHIFDHDARAAKSSVNFIAAHDGFTLRDTVSFNDKHNHANGEHNRDGHGHNLSDNMGAEGETDNPHINAARRQRQKNMLATLLLSQGTPMLLAGDEFGHSQRGNNNAYCQDNEMTWLNWEARDTELEDFTRALIALRQAYPHFTQGEFLHGQEIGTQAVKTVEWITASGDALQTHDWEDPHQSCLGLALSVEGEDSVLVMINRGEAREFRLDDTQVTHLLSSSNDPVETGVLPANSVSVFKTSGYYRTPQFREQAINRLAEDFGVIDHYRDISGHVHSASSQTKTALLKAMKIDLGSGPIPAPHSPASPKPSSVYGAQMLREQGGGWGVTAALYALRSERNWGMGDFEDLAVLAEIMAKKGADFIGINPVHALFPAAPHLYAPYSPSSREFLNVMLIAPDKIPELPQALRAAPQLAQGPEHVDYAAVYRAKMNAFEAAFEAFCALKKTTQRRKDFAAFVKAGGEALQHHALFDAIFETLPPDRQTYEGWHNFPNGFEDPRTQACRTFAKTHAARLEFYAYLQWTAQTQLSAAQDRARMAGMSIGLYLDFAVGVVPGGADAWRNKDAFARHVSLGAPGDMANPDGQVWNLLPYDPQALIRRDYEPYRSALRKAMTLGGAIRIDHILGHLRSFWIPQDSAGGYVRYPFEGLLHMIAQESRANQCVVFGEDLGTVPDGFRDRMADFDLMGCNIALIERDSAGTLLPPEAMRELSITGFSNHDFPTLTGFWDGEDFRWRKALGIGDDPNTIAWEAQRREADKAALLSAVGWNDAPIMTATLMAQLQAYMASAPALAFAVQLDDLMLEPMQANVPGTTDEQPNWRRRSRLSLEEVAVDPDVGRICTSICDARAGHDARKGH